jgi:hypothetical protein
MLLMEVLVCRSVGAVPFSMFLRIREPLLVRIAMLRIELLVKAIVLRVIEKVTEEVLDGV